MIKVDAAKLMVRLDAITKAAHDLRPAWLRIITYTNQETGLTFRALARGGTYRGVHWKWFAPQYRRKTDGAIVPAEGGVPKLRGGGLVKGRLRPSGKRVTKQSRLLRDTGALSASAGVNMKSPDFRTWTLTNQRMRGRIPEDYAARQQKLRKFFFWTEPTDTRYISRAVAEHVSGKKQATVVRKGSLLESLRAMRT